MIRRAWSPTAARGLARAAGEDLDDVAEDVIGGRAALYELAPGTYAVLRMEQAHAYRECVLVCGEGRELHRHMPTLEAAARRWGAQRLRAHVSRPGMVRMLARHGLTVAQTVLTKRLDDGQ